MKRVLHIINGESYAGAERVQDLLALRLPQFGYEVGFACVKPGRFAQLRASRDTPLHETPMTSRLGFGVVRTIARIARDGGYAAIHTHTVRNAMIGRPVSWLTGLPVVHHVHSPVRSDTEDARRNRINALVDEHFVQPGAQRLIAVSTSLRDYLVAHGTPAARIRVVPNGVPAPAAASPWQPPAGPWTVGAMALFRPRKGLAVLIEAIARLRARDVPVRLLAVGGFETGAHEHELRALAQARGIAGHVEWAGFASDVQPALARMDVFALPSLYGEGMPMVVLEAMAAGRPVVGSAIDGVPEVLGRGACGLLVPPDDPAALADAIGSLVADPARAAALAGAARDAHRDRFSDVAMARGVAAVYDEVLNARG